MESDLMELRRSKAKEWESRTTRQTTRSRSPRRIPMEIDSCPELQSIKALTWNVDGLNENSDEDDLLGRTLWVIKEIGEIQPNVVFLQELVEFSFSIIEQKCRNTFHVFRQVHSNQPYFVAILVHKATMDIIGQPARVPFPHSQMGREGLFVSVRPKNHPKNLSIGLLTAHLESLRDFASERKSQFEICTNHIHKQQVDFSIFGGDLNARDTDVPNSLTTHDCWILAGKPSKHQYTWDLTQNKNVVFPNGSQPRCRFDRLYLIPGKDKRFRPPIEKFELVGTERIPNLGHASDHFGVLIEVSLK